MLSQETSKLSGQTPKTASHGHLAPGVYAVESEMHLLDRFAVLYRYRTITSAVFVLTTLAVMLQGYTAVPLYQAQAQLLIEDERTTAMPGIATDTSYAQDPEPVLPDAIQDSQRTRPNSSRREEARSQGRRRIQRHRRAGEDAVDRGARSCEPDAHHGRTAPGAAPRRTAASRRRCRRVRDGRHDRQPGPGRSGARQQARERHVHRHGTRNSRRSPSTRSRRNTSIRTSRSSSRRRRTCSTGSSGRSGRSKIKWKRTTARWPNIATNRMRSRSTTNRTSCCRG